MKILSSILLLFATAGLYAEEAEWHKFIVQAGVLMHPHVFQTTALNPTNYPQSFDGSFETSVGFSLQGIAPGTKTLVYYPALHVRIEHNQDYLVFAGSEKNRILINVYYPPLPVTQGLVLIEDALYPIARVRGWMQEIQGTNPELYWDTQREALQKKRLLDRHLAHTLRQERRCLHLEARLGVSDDNNERITILLQLAEAYTTIGYYERAEDAYRRLAKLPITAEISLRIAHGYALIAYYRNHTEEAILRMEALLPQARAYIELQADMQLDLARLHEKQGNTEDARSYYLKVSSSEGIQPSQKAFALFNLGELEREAQAHTRALGYYTQSMAIFRQYYMDEKWEGSSTMPAYYFVLEKRIADQGR